MKSDGLQMLVIESLFININKPVLIGNMWVVVDQSKQKLLGTLRQWEKEISVLFSFFQTNSLNFKILHI